MYISLNWISDYVNLEGVDPKELALKLTMSTAEVEDVIFKGEDVQQVVVGKVVKVEPHPKSEKLKIVQVDTGNETIQSVCGAPNVTEGILVPFAKIGGRILKIPKIEKTMLAGEESCGILCSGAEIGVNHSSDRLLILDPALTPGTHLKEIYAIDDVIIEIDNKSLTHRPDLWGHYGIAREIAAILKRPLAPVPKMDLPYDENLPNLQIRIENPDKCPRYSCITVENVKENATPLNIQMRLYYCGQNPKSLLVDLSNYVMMDVGQPNHAFDHEYAKSIVVKFPPAPIEKFNTLDSVERRITEDILMIYNEDTPVALAGIMGGEDSEITDSTVSLFLESANFDAYTIRTGATKLGMRTDASARFEKSLDPELTVLAIKRFLYLLLNTQPDVKITSNLSDLYVKKPETITVQFDKPYLDRYIGKVLSTETVMDILERLEFKVAHQEGHFTIEVPHFRATKDIGLKVDLVEEVTRIYGYDNIEPQTVEVPLEPLKHNEDRLLEHKIKDLLAEKFGLHESQSYIWYDNDFNNRLGIQHPSFIEVVNPMAKEMNHLRVSLVPAMLQFAERNVNQFDVTSLFEIGKVFYQGEKSNNNECDERKYLCMMLSDKTQKEDQLFYRLKGIASYLGSLLRGVEFQYESIDDHISYPWIHPEKSAVIKVDNRPLGYLSVIHPSVGQKIDKKAKIAVLEINFRDLFNLKEQPILFKEISRFPEVTLDFSFLVQQNVPFIQVDSHVAAFSHEYLKSYRYVLMYEGKNLPEGTRSLTFSFTLGSPEKTLVTDDINHFLNLLIQHMEKKGYVLRKG